MELDIPGVSGRLVLALEVAQLILAMGPTPHIVQLHLVAVVRGLLFL
jgi:hypothetical protein